jgi:hypothetical protein
VHLGRPPGGPKAASLAARLETVRCPTSLPRLPRQPHAPPPPLAPTQAILEALAAALVRYTRRGVAVAYDALSCVARALGPRLSDPALAGVVMPPLAAKLLNAPPGNKVWPYGSARPNALPPPPH